MLRLRQGWLKSVSVMEAFSVLGSWGLGGIFAYLAFFSFFLKESNFSLLSILGLGQWVWVCIRYVFWVFFWLFWWFRLCLQSFKHHFWLNVADLGRHVSFAFLSNSIPVDFKPLSGYYGQLPFL